MRKINFDQHNFPLVLPNNGALFQWCCECSSRHIWTFEILRGETEGDDELLINCFRDELAEGLRKVYEKTIKKTEKKGE